jgi:FecR protein
MMDDYEAWEPEPPPRGFAERVVDAARREESTLRERGRARRIGAVVAVAFVAAVAAGAVLAPSRPLSHGDATATNGRAQVQLGARAIGVLEPGAHVAWEGDDVTQSKGDVFYRVEPGAAPFRVHTPSGDVTVLGTCFHVDIREESAMNSRDVRAGIVGAVAGAAVLVGVYEGKVALSQPKGGSVVVAPGESAIADGNGVRATGAAGGNVVASAEPDSLLTANASLVDSVRAYKAKLDAIEQAKKDVEKQLAAAQTELATAENDGQAPAQNSHYDLSKDDWKELAKKGEVAARFPCPRPDAWSLSPKTLDKLGLPPQDGAIISKAFASSYGRTWSAIQPLCAQALGGSMDIATKVGEAACIAVIGDVAAQKDSAASDEAVRLAAEVNAGERPAPGPNDDVNPVERMMLALSNESKNVVGDLSQSVGPDDAKRIVYGDEGGCWSNSTWGVGPRGSASSDPSSPPSP